MMCDGNTLLLLHDAEPVCVVVGDDRDVHGKDSSRFGKTKFNGNFLTARYVGLLEIFINKSGQI